MDMYEARIQRVLEAMKTMGLEQMIVSDPDSIWYLTGYYVYPFERLFVLYLPVSYTHLFQGFDRMTRQMEEESRDI